MLIATNFYTHFGLSNANLNEYDTDIMLEYEESDTYKEFKEFFYDVISEFEKFGKITQFKVSEYVPIGLSITGHRTDIENMMLEPMYPLN